VDVFQVARRAKLHPAIVERAESATGSMPITAYQSALLRDALEAAGIEFTNGDVSGVKLKKDKAS
jgi:hypothetical protein